MNVIEAMRALLTSFPKITSIVHMDIADDIPESYGLASVGDKLVSEDVIGREKRQHSFLLYATYSGLNDFERISNSGVLLELAQWLDKQQDIKIDNGYITKISTGNGMLYAIPDENMAQGVQYQMQITVEYTVEIDD